ncbi:hypothetical protein BJ170DRAFT_731223 [Xylariales sp. AK1849]|nr:hypothetical protein BJ170DRAFT_731223 [Xylariales sp. AK1849]
MITRKDADDAKEFWNSFISAKAMLKTMKEFPGWESDLFEILGQISDGSLSGLHTYVARSAASVRWRRRRIKSKTRQRRNRPTTSYIVVTSGLLLHTTIESADSRYCRWKEVEDVRDMRKHENRKRKTYNTKDSLAVTSKIEGSLGEIMQSLGIIRQGRNGWMNIIFTCALIFHVLNPVHHFDLYFDNVEYQMLKITSQIAGISVSVKNKKQKVPRPQYNNDTEFLIGKSYAKHCQALPSTSAKSRRPTAQAIKREIPLSRLPDSGRGNLLQLSTEAGLRMLLTLLYFYINRTMYWQNAAPLG